MSEKLGILFLHHSVDPVVQNNLASIREQNPQAVIATMSAGECLPNGYNLEKTPELKLRHSAAPERSSDILVCSWFLQRKESCDKWWIVEWDTYCTMSAREYYDSVWRYPFVASSVALRHRQPEWYWFTKVKEMPEEYRHFAAGTSPFLYLLSEPALKATCEMLIRFPLAAGNGELRFATAANRCGYPACGFSPPDDQITWMAVTPVIDRRAVFHPVKKIVENRVPKKK